MVDPGGASCGDYSMCFVSLNRYDTDYFIKAPFMYWYRTVSSNSIHTGYRMIGPDFLNLTCDHYQYVHVFSKSLIFESDTGTGTGTGTDMNI